MTLKDFYTKYPKHIDCIEHLEQVFWNNKPVCPYCDSSKQTAFLNEPRYHCTGCKTSYSVTVRTLFHKTKCDLQKWFFAIHQVINHRYSLSARQMGREIGVTKDTSVFMIRRIKRALLENHEAINNIINN